MLRLLRLVELFLNDERFVVAPLLGPPFFTVGDLLAPAFLKPDFLKVDLLNDVSSLRSRPEPELDFLLLVEERPPVEDRDVMSREPVEARLPVENFLPPFLRPAVPRSSKTARPKEPSEESDRDLLDDLRPVERAAGLSAEREDLE